MRRRSFLPPPVWGPSNDPSTSSSPSSSKPFSLRFRKSPGPSSPPTSLPPARARRSSRSSQRETTEQAEGEVVDISPHSELPDPTRPPELGFAGGMGERQEKEGKKVKEEREEKERKRLRDEAARSLGWGSGDALAAAGADVPSPGNRGALAGRGKEQRGSFLALGGAPVPPPKEGKRHSLGTFLGPSPSGSRISHAPTSPPSSYPSTSPPPAPAPAPAPPAPPLSPPPPDRLYALPSPPLPFPSPLSALLPHATLSSPITLPPSSGLLSILKPRTRFLLLTRDGQLGLFRGKEPHGRDREVERLDLVSGGGGSVSALLPEGDRTSSSKSKGKGKAKAKEENMLRVEGILVTADTGGNGNGKGKGKEGQGQRTSWTFVCGSRAEMGEWIRAVERVLELLKPPSVPAPGSAAANGVSSGEPTVVYPTSISTGVGGRRLSTGVVSPPTVSPPAQPTQPVHIPQSSSVTNKQNKRQSLSPDRPPLFRGSSSPLSALPIGPSVGQRRHSGRPSTAPSYRSFHSPPPPTEGLPPLPAADQHYNDSSISTRRGSLGASALASPPHAAEGFFSSPSSPSPERQPPITAHQLGQHPFGASSTSLRDREVRESLPPPRRPRPGSSGGSRPLSPAPSVGSREAARGGAGGGRSPESGLPPAPGATMSPPVPAGQAYIQAPLRVDTTPSGLSNPPTPRRRTPKRPSTAPSLSSPAGVFPTSGGSLKRRSGVLPPLSPPPTHPIPAPPIEQIAPTPQGSGRSSPAYQQPNGRSSPGQANRDRGGGERRMSGLAGLPGPPTTNGIGGYVNGTRSRPGSAGGRTVRLLPDTPAGGPDLVGLGITSPNVQRRMTPPPRPPPTGALPAPPVEGDNEWTNVVAQKHRSLPASPCKTSPSPPHTFSPSQSPENVLGDSLTGGYPFPDPKPSTEVQSEGQKVPTGESFFESHSPDMEQSDSWPPRASSVLLGDEADRFWKEATASLGRKSGADVLVEKYEPPTQDTTSFERPGLGTAVSTRTATTV